MRRFIACCAALLALASISDCLRADETNPPATTTGENTAPAATESDPSANVPPGPDAWRYRWHDGYWWYYLPAGSWVYWNGANWAPFIAPPAAPDNAAMFANGPADYGPLNYGPMHFGAPNGNAPSSGRSGPFGGLFTPHRGDNYGWVGGFYSSGGGYGSPGFGYGRTIPSYGPGYGRYSGD